MRRATLPYAAVQGLASQSDGTRVENFKKAALFRRHQGGRFVTAAKYLAIRAVSDDPSGGGKKR